MQYIQIISCIVAQSQWDHYLTHQPWGFLPFTQNIFRQLIPKNSWPLKTFCCESHHEEMKSKSLVVSPLRALWNMGVKIAHTLEGKVKNRLLSDSHNLLLLRSIFGDILYLLRHFLNFRWKYFCCYYM